MPADASAPFVPLTLVLVHGAWMNPLCWEKFQARYEAAGHRVLAPAWPYDDRPVAELRAAPDPRLAEVGLEAITSHYAAAIAALPVPPVLIGHSFGGLIVQLLLQRGLGSCGVAIDSAPPRGILPGGAALKANLPVVTTLGGARKILTMKPEHFARDFASNLSAADARTAYERYSVPTPGKPFFEVALAKPSCAVDFGKSDRAPLLLVAGQKDRTVTTGMNRSNYQKYKKKSSATTEFHEFPGRSHFLICEPGWEEVADFALGWARQNARP
jgi:pimeloyl-ACP methyl ester carboxylesterase